MREREREREKELPPAAMSSPQSNNLILRLFPARTKSIAERFYASSFY